MNGLATDQILITKGSGSVTVAGVTAGTVVTTTPRLKGGSMQGLVVKLAVSAISVTGSVTAKLQTAIGNDWVDSKTVALTATGPAYITLLAAKAADQTYFPMLLQARVVIVNTNAADTVTLTEVDLLQEV